MGEPNRQSHSVGVMESKEEDVLTCFGPNMAPMLSLMLWLPPVLSTGLRLPCPVWLVQVMRTPEEIMQ